VTADAMFNVPPPAPGKVSPGKVILADGRAVVFAVSRVIPGDPAEATADQKASLQQQLAGMAGADDVEGLVKALRKRAIVTIAEDRL
jgi:peptidyl-prolyl cis-trans isomerase D